MTVFHLRSDTHKGIMFTIRKEQMDVFIRVELRKFEDWMVVHVNRFFPKQFQSLGEAEMRETIQYGIGRAAAYGITSRRDVCKYIDLMVVFGRELDTDRRYPWAGEVVRQPWDAEAKITALQQAAVGHLRKT
jgi:hypothetical protein